MAIASVVDVWCSFLFFLFFSFFFFWQRPQYSILDNELYLENELNFYASVLNSNCGDSPVLVEAERGQKR